MRKEKEELEHTIEQFENDTLISPDILAPLDSLFTIGEIRHRLTHEVIDPVQIRWSLALSFIGIGLFESDMSERAIRQQLIETIIGFDIDSSREFVLDEYGFSTLKYQFVALGLIELTNSDSCWWKLTDKGKATFLQAITVKASQPSLPTTHVISGVIIKDELDELFNQFREENS